MMTKSNTILIILMMFASCAGTKLDKSSSSEVIEIDYVDLSLFTSIRVSCTDFPEYFKSTVKHKEITDSNEIASFVKKMLSLEEIKSGPSPDVRMVVKIYHDGKLWNACIGFNYISFSGKSYKNNDDLRTFLERYTE